MSQLYTTLAHIAQNHPEQLCLWEGETQWTYPDFLQYVDRAAQGFRASGVEPGDRVGLMLYNQKEFLVCLFALRKLGAVIVPINLQMLVEDIRFVIINAGLKQVVITESLYPQLSPYPLNLIVVEEEASAESFPLAYTQFLNSGNHLEDTSTVYSQDTDLAFLIYTSGTTGYPKGVMLTEYNLLTNMAGFKRIIDFDPHQHLLLALPLFHAYGLIIALTALQVGASLSLVPKFHPKNIVEALLHRDITILPLVPTLYSVILELLERHGNPELKHLRLCVSGGASLPVSLIDRIESTLHATLIEGYGLTETAPVLCVNDPKVGSIPGSVGKPLYNVTLRIVNENDQPLPQGEIGEIQAKGDNIMSGYYNLPEETQQAFTPDGWFKTGDLGHFDTDGNLYISGGRKKDLIIKAGENIAPMSIESALYKHPAVQDAAVIGMPDEKLGEDIMAYVRLKDEQDVSAPDLIRFCREHLTNSYVPKRIEFLAELPKNATGKIMKKQLRERLLQERGIQTV